jgi:DNA mismatch endonuclease (patch repair protein)
MSYDFGTVPLKRSVNMRHIKSQNTSPERCLAKELWGKGIRYRKHNSKIYGNPDITITKNKIAIFIDGEFWHGYNWDEKKDRIKVNREYWIPKIEKTILRDKHNTKILTDNGWTVIRLWEHEIRKNMNACIDRIINEINRH